MKLDSDQIKHVAKLANLPLSEEELTTYGQQLSAILEYIDQLNQVNTDNIEPTYNVSPNLDIEVPDEIKESLTQEEALQNAPAAERGFFVTKGVFAEE